MAARKRKTEPADPEFARSLAQRREIAEQRGLAGGSRSRRLSVRVEAPLLAEAKRVTGIDNDSELVRVALAALAVPDDYGQWLVEQAGRLDPDFAIDF